MYLILAELVKERGQYIGLGLHTTIRNLFGGLSDLA